MVYLAAKPSEAGRRGLVRSLNRAAEILTGGIATSGLMHTRTESLASAIERVGRDPHTADHRRYREPPGVDPLQPGRVLFGLLLGLWVLVRSGTSGEPALCAAAQQVQSLLATSLPSPCTTSP